MMTIGVRTVRILPILSYNVKENKIASIKTLTCWKIINIWTKTNEFRQWKNRFFVEWIRMPWKIDFFKISGQSDLSNLRIIDQNLSSSIYSNKKFYCFLNDTPLSWLSTAVIDLKDDTIFSIEILKAFHYDSEYKWKKARRKIGILVEMARV